MHPMLLAKVRFRSRPRKIETGRLTAPAPTALPDLIGGKASKPRPCFAVGITRCHPPRDCSRACTTYWQGIALFLGYTTTRWSKTLSCKDSKDILFFSCPEANTTYAVFQFGLPDKFLRGLYAPPPSTIMYTASSPLSCLPSRGNGAPSTLCVPARDTQTPADGGNCEDMITKNRGNNTKPPVFAISGKTEGASGGGRGDEEDRSQVSILDRCVSDNL